MILLGRISFVLGLVLTIIGLVAGFGLLFADIDNWAKFFLMLVPLGFVIGFAGLATHILFEPREHENGQDRQ